MVQDEASNVLPLIFSSNSCQLYFTCWVVYFWLRHQCTTGLLKWTLKHPKCFTSNSYQILGSLQTFLHCHIFFVECFGEFDARSRLSLDVFVIIVEYNEKGIQNIIVSVREGLEGSVKKYERYKSLLKDFCISLEMYKYFPPSGKFRSHIVESQLPSSLSIILFHHVQCIKSVIALL